MASFEEDDAAALSVEGVRLDGDECTTTAADGSDNEEQEAGGEGGGTGTAPEDAGGAGTAGGGARRRKARGGKRKKKPAGSSATDGDAMTVASSAEPPSAAAEHSQPPSSAVAMACTAESFTGVSVEEQWEVAERMMNEIKESHARHKTLWEEVHSIHEKRNEWLEQMRQCGDEMEARTSHEAITKAREEVRDKPSLRNDALRHSRAQEMRYRGRKAAFKRLNDRIVKLTAEIQVIERTHPVARAESLLLVMNDAIASGEAPTAVLCQLAREYGGLGFPCRDDELFFTTAASSSASSSS